MIKLRSLWSRLSVRVTLIPLIPLLLITATFSVLNIQARNADLERNIELMAQTRAAFAANDADIALYSEDVDGLESIMASTLALKETIGVMFLNKEQAVITSSKDFSLPPEKINAIIQQGNLTDNYFYYRQAVYLSGIDFSDYGTEFVVDEENPLVGWVIVAIDITQQRNLYIDMIISTAIIALLGLLVAALLSIMLSRSLISPIMGVSRTVRRISEGELSARAEDYSLDEFSILGNGINRMADSIEEATSNLEAKVNDATAKLKATLGDLQQKNYELQIARETAEKANFSKTQFLARMSHELRTPITSIQGFARLLFETSVNDIDRQHCQIIDQAADQLLLLINDILDYSKLQSNTVVLDKGTFNLIECLEQVAGLFSLSAFDKKLEFVFDISPSVAVMRYGDEKRVRQVINNLLSNAIKFTNSGGVYIMVGESEQPDCVRISIIDTGIGIKEDHRNRLFQAFSQADTSISRQYGGTGLGLSIAKHLVDLMEGKLFFYSTTGRGSDFIAEIPLPVVEEDQRQPSSVEKVLVYHQSRPAFTAIRHALERHGISAASAKTANVDPAEWQVIIIYLPPHDYLEPGFSEMLLSLRERAPGSRFIIVTPVINMHNLLSSDELKKLHPVTFVSNPPTISGLREAIEKSDDSHAAGGNIKPAYLDGLNILIAEDNQFTCLLLETLIERYGGVFSTATNGIEAIKISNREPFDAMLIDMHMPELDGLQAIREIREVGVNKNTPIIALTADLQQQEKNILLDAGANEVLLKPFNETHLLEVIRKCVGLTPTVLVKEEKGDPKDIKSQYFKEIARLAKASEEALGKEDWPELRENIHQLLGIAGVFSDKDIQQTVEELHRAAREKQSVQAESQLKKLNGQLPEEFLRA